MEGNGKTILMIREEFSQKLAELINESGLPLFIVEPLLANAASQVSNLVRQQYEQELAAYNKAQEEAKDGASDS